MNTNIWNNEKIKTKSKAPVTNAKAEWRKRRDMDDLATEKVQSEDKDGYEEGEGQEDAAEDDGPSAESFDQSGGQRQSKTKSKKNQSMQSGTGIRFERNSSSPPSRISWLQQSLDDSTPLRRTFLAILVAALFLYRGIERRRRDQQKIRNSLTRRSRHYSFVAIVFSSSLFSRYIVSVY